jgi:hypothetical protein
MIYDLMIHDLIGDEECRKPNGRLKKFMKKYSIRSMGG